MNREGLGRTLALAGEFAPGTAPRSSLARPAARPERLRPRGEPPSSTDAYEPAWIDGPWVWARSGDPMASARAGGVRDGWRTALRADPCCYCGEPVLPPRPGDVPRAGCWARGVRGSVEHLVPRRDQARGEGLDGNTVGACARCNKGRGDRTVLEMLLWRRGGPARLF